MYCMWAGVIWVARCWPWYSKQGVELVGQRSAHLNLLKFRLFDDVCSILHCVVSKGMIHLPPRTVQVPAQLSPSLVQYNTSALFHAQYLCLTLKRCNAFARCTWFIQNGPSLYSYCHKILTPCRFRYEIPPSL